MAKTKLCEICGHEFLCKTSAKVCSEECRKIYYQRASRRAYENSKTKYTCIKCGKEKFTDNIPEDKLCRHCRKNHYQFKNQVTQQTLCKHCLKVLTSKTINLTRPDCEHIIWKVCDDCKEVNKQLTSERMKLTNPRYLINPLPAERYDYKQTLYNRCLNLKHLGKMRDKEYLELRKLVRDNTAEAECKLDQLENMPLEECRALITTVSDRMKVHNPMFRADVREKVSQTMKRKLEAGEINHPRGKKHYSWKGNNNYVRNVLRRSIKFWRIENLKRANYTCERCGKNHCELHIHHKDSFFEIVNRCAENLNIDIKKLNVVNPETNDYDEMFLKLQELVIDYHKEHKDIGIVVCLDCHDIIDPQFKKPHRKKIEDENKEYIKREL